ncbi:hypothetical protein AMAG_07423 [Allomyces macrogynus ATCC 38327]|uniref:PhoD-like phosphatase metallophosphatase domain-containing protein n=1 Tax=Allomyces macrogynus (strain ATCC 38327) TaxID=578462 RepID=A0A0L0SI30_ALLM3|nr:hypothetical protein AMAG_07423 [Allomyces macrogynus ATCC 38327]|eukprot:KNE62178.1 hypothetical protein AMAG_07423 [Allomyces macrogynus ATCC 38327]
MSGNAAARAARRVCCSPTRIAMGPLAFATVGFIVMATMTLVRTPYRQLLPYEIAMFAVALVFLAVWGALWLRARRLRARSAAESNSKPGSTSKAAPSSPKPVLAMVAAVVAIMAVLLGLVFDNNWHIRMYSHSDVRTVRLGAVTGSFASVIVRDPTAKSITVTLTAPETKKFDVTVPVTQDNDFVGIARFTGLSGGAEHAVQVKNDRGEDVKPASGQELKIKTLPTKNPDSFKVAFGSCNLPFPYRHGMAGFKNVLDMKPDLFLHMGDFIYADVPFQVGDSTENFRRLYRRNLNDAYYMELAQSVPSLHMFDDHEIFDNWVAGAPPVPYAPTALAVYREHVHNAMPHEADPVKPNPTWFYNVTVGSNLATIFMSNTRAFRKPASTPAASSKDLESADATFLGSDQLAAIDAWLQDAQQRNVTWKVFVSSVPFSPNYVDPDTWYGARRERAAILKRADELGVHNLIVLSGDRHEVGVFEIPRNLEGARSVEFSVSPLHAFYDDLPSIKEEIEPILFKDAGARSYAGAIEISEQEVKFAVRRMGEPLYDLTVKRTK